MLLITCTFLHEIHKVNIFYIVINIFAMFFSRLPSGFRQPHYNFYGAIPTSKPQVPIDPHSYKAMNSQPEDLSHSTKS